MQQCISTTSTLSILRLDCMATLQYLDTSELCLGLCLPWTWVVMTVLAPVCAHLSTHPFVVCRLSLVRLECCDQLNISEASRCCSRCSRQGAARPGASSHTLQARPKMCDAGAALSWSTLHPWLCFNISMMERAPG